MNRPMMTRRIREIELLSRLPAVLEVMRVVGEEHERREAGRTDRVAFGDGFGRVADGVERVGDVPDFLGRFDISAMPPALSVIGPNASSATIMPVIDSIAVAAIAMP